MTYLFDFSYLSPDPNSAKRTYEYLDEDGHCYRSNFQRDRDRILYSRSFRRLYNKTQIFLAGNKDYARNRLTHSLEVAQIAKTVAKCLNLDIDLTEAIALGHDIGHTPFGHIGEYTLHKIMISDIKIKSDFKFL